MSTVKGMHDSCHLLHLLHLSKVFLLFDVFRVINSACVAEEFPNLLEAFSLGLWQQERINENTRRCDGNELAIYRRSVKMIRMMADGVSEESKPKTSPCRP